MSPDTGRASEPAGQEGVERARLFVALELAGPAQAELIRWRDEPLRRIAGLRPVAPDALHATLCFLGSRPVAAIDAIAAACETIATDREVVLSLGAALWLPRRRPRVLAVALEDADQGQRLMRLQSKLAAALAAGGSYEPSDRPFLAHVTVARVPGAARVRATALPPPAPLPFTAMRVTLFRSRLGRPQARYEPLATVRLRER